MNQKPSLDIVTSVQFSDLHMPFHDKRAWDLALEITDDIDPDEIILMGDFGDIYTFSKFNPHPEIRTDAEEEALIIHSELRMIKNRYKKAKLIYICGNHEMRLIKRLIENPMFWGLTTIEKYLGLDELGITFIPYGPNQRYHVLGLPDLIAQHEPSGGGENHARATLKKNLISTIYAHHHNYQRVEQISRDGKKIISVSLPCLADKNHMCLQYPKNHHQWSEGFGVTTKFPSGTWIQDVVIFENYKAVYGGFAYQ